MTFLSDGDGVIIWVSVDPHAAHTSTTLLMEDLSRLASHTVAARGSVAPSSYPQKKKCAHVTEV